MIYECVLLGGRDKFWEVSNLLEDHLFKNLFTSNNYNCVIG